MSTLPRTALFVSLLAACPALANAQDDASSKPPAACVTARTDPVFAAFDAQRPAWEAQYQIRKSEFRPKMLERADEMSRCVERALRRDLGANSRTTFGVQIDPDGRVAKVAMLDSNHANNLYGNCIARTLCAIQMSRLDAPAPEVIVFNFNMRRQSGPHQRPWSIDPAR